LAEFDKASVRAFLKRFKRAVRDRRSQLPIFEDNDAIAELGLTRKNCVEEILCLSVEDYHSGPDPDHDAQGYVWTFGSSIRGHEVYIKLKLAEWNGEDKPKCLSFHRAKQALKYPFRIPDDRS